MAAERSLTYLLLLFFPQDINTFINLNKSSLQEDHEIQHGDLLQIYCAKNVDSVSGLQITSNQGDFGEILDIAHKNMSKTFSGFPAGETACSSLW